MQIAILVLYIIRTNVPIGTFGFILILKDTQLCLSVVHYGVYILFCVCTESTRRWEVSFQFNPINVVPFGTEMKSFVTIG